MGTERTGPDLTDVGNRQASKDWNLMHLYQPRSVVKQSIMPSYKWLFEMKLNPSKNDVVVSMPAEFLDGKPGKLVAKKEALQLVAYILSLKQTPLPTGTVAQEFLYKKAVGDIPSSKTGDKTVDGKALYDMNCAACHQANGEGLKGAFPPLKGSAVVAGDDLELYVDIIMNGYDARADYGVMAAVGTNMNFTEFDVAAIINYERTSWVKTRWSLKKVGAKSLAPIFHRGYAQIILLLCRNFNFYKIHNFFNFFGRDCCTFVSP